MKASTAAPILLGQVWDLAHEDSASVDLLAAVAAPAWREKQTQTRQLQACAALFALLGALWCGHGSIWYRAVHHLEQEIGLSSCSSLSALEKAIERREEAVDKLASHTRVRTKTKLFAQQLGQLCATWPSTSGLHLDRVVFAGATPPSLTISCSTPELVHKLRHTAETTLQIPVELHEEPEAGLYRLTLRQVKKGSL